MKKYVVHDEIPELIKIELASYPELIQNLLYRRGITTQTTADAFLNPDYEKHLHDPFLMKDMDRAVSRILDGMKRKEKIVVYSDYDCDGIPGGVLLHTLFKKLNYAHATNYIPHRHEEGYGLNNKAIDTLCDAGVTLMITVDCGITDVDQVARAQAQGMDVIVTDHHLPGEKLPSAYAIVNPKRADDSYPEPMLCGGGVAFKLSQAMLTRGDFKIPKGWEKWLLDLAGLSTIADMVPLTGENRAIAYFGLKVLRKSLRPGIQKLCRKMHTDQRYLTEDDIGFMIAPRINAASRMDEPMQAFRLLATDDEGEADVLAAYLHKVNDMRKGIVASMAKEIKKRILLLGGVRELIVMGDPRWRPALLGLAANTLMEEYQRPVFLWGREGAGVLKGSCRSDGSVDVTELMRDARGLFIDSGGHAYAGGFSLLQETLHLVEERLITSYLRLRRPVDYAVSYKVDGELSLSDVTWETYRSLERLAPFGEGNPKPIFAFPAVTVSGVKWFGKEKNHLELSFETPSGGVVRASAFFMKPTELTPGSRIDLLASLERSHFSGRSLLRLRIVEILE